VAIRHQIRSAACRTKTRSRRVCRAGTASTRHGDRRDAELDAVVRKGDVTPSGGRLPDREQRRLLERLRQADGEPVSFAQLRADGTDFPATLVSELMLEGYPIERVHEHGRAVGVRLQEPSTAAREPRSRWPDPAPADGDSQRTGRGFARALAPGAGLPSRGPSSDRSLSASSGCLFALLVSVAAWGAIVAVALIAIR
jgi:hypothetical protein